MFVDTSKVASPGPLIEIQKSGEPAEKVDFLILGDGYTAAERGKFEKDARRLVEILFAASPYKEHRKDFNVWALCPAAAESGISRPSTGVHRDSPLGASYDAFGSERYVLTFENRALRTVASHAPYEFVEIITNSHIRRRRNLRFIQHCGGGQRANVRLRTWFGITSLVLPTNTINHRGHTGRL